MKEIINKYKSIIVQIATPYSMGTGFYLKDKNLIVTNEHVVRDNREVVINGEGFEKQMTKVIFLDIYHDLAFLQAPSIIEAPSVEFFKGKEIERGEVVIAAGHPFGLKYSTTQGIVSNIEEEKNDLIYIQHDAALNPGNSGGPLINKSGEIVGINTFVIQNGNNVGFSLPVDYLQKTIKEFQAGESQIGMRCSSCSNIVFEKKVDNNYCPHCEAKIQMPSKIDEYEALGVSKTMEELLDAMGHHVGLSRIGLNHWEIIEGSANIKISYHEKTGLIMGDASLCLLPKENINPLYEYLLKQNYEIEGLTFSIKENDIVLSLLIYDRYLNMDTGMNLFKYLFERADYYDNILVEEYGAIWKNEK
jgi:serine protease Do